MALTVVQDVSYESWGGFTDPRLPERIWKGRMTTTGDASGGDLSAFFRFNLAGNDRLDLHYSLEEVYIDDQQAATITLRFQTRNFGSLKTGVRPISVFMVTQGTEAPTAAFNIAQRKDAIPMFLGQQVFTGTGLEMVFDRDNDNGVTTIFWCGGYVWGPRSTSAPNGGLVRPNPGLFPV